MGKIYYIMGKSSSGKDTIYKEIKNKLADLNTVTLYTTRPIREGEADGVEYFFVNNSECERLCNAGKVIELRAYDTVHGVWKYFTVDDEQIHLQEMSYLMIGTLESYQKMKEYYGTGVMVPIYIDVEDGLRLSRAIERERMQGNPKYAELCRRFLADSEDFSVDNLRVAEIERRFENIDLDVCIDEIILFINEKI